MPPHTGDFSGLQARQSFPCLRALALTVASAWSTLCPDRCLGSLSLPTKEGGREAEKKGREGKQGKEYHTAIVIPVTLGYNERQGATQRCRKKDDKRPTGITHGGRRGRDAGLETPGVWRILSAFPPSPLSLAQPPRTPDNTRRPRTPAGAGAGGEDAPWPSNLISFLLPTGNPAASQGGSPDTGF